MTQSVAELHMVPHKKHNAILLEAAKTFIGPDTQIGMPPATLTPTWLDNYVSQDGSQNCLTIEDCKFGEMEGSSLCR